MTVDRDRLGDRDGLDLLAHSPAVTSIQVWFARADALAPSPLEHLLQALSDIGGIIFRQTIAAEQDRVDDILNRLAPLSEF